ncbi:MAG: hypothetical protein Q8Q48_01090 [Candidatus Staskawiczbacteria bacterium]|nr:hypothetical protein [Candidatus Staskawiczbacteria bacterium]
MNSEFLRQEKTSEEKLKEKEDYWQAVDQEMDDVGDALGKEIDPGIRKTVVALNVMGLTPDGSCEGHLDWGCPHPWVDIAEPNEPERFKGESAEKMKEETDEYKKWIATNKELREMVERLLEEFYKGREVSKEMKIGIENIGGTGLFRLQNGDNIFLGEKEYGIKKKKKSKLAKDLTPDEKEKLKDILPILRGEMDAFGDFLKNKFLNDENI